MTEVKRRSYSSYAGPSIQGTSDWEVTGTPEHWDRVLWLTSMVESGGKFGAITMYDGTAMTAGLHQAIAVYPKELRHEDFAAQDDQGSLWKLLRMLEMVPDFPALQDLWDALAAHNWYVSTDGHLRYLEDGKVVVKGRNRRVQAGDLVYGYDIRENFTPNEGKVPARGPKWEQSKRWALLFHAVFSDPKSFPAQVKFGQEHFHQYCGRKQIKAGATKTLGKWLYQGNYERPRIDSEELDLALAVLWSHSVNAPSVAWKIVRQSLVRHDPANDPEEFARDLMRRLASSDHGRWNRSISSGRWQRTRTFAKRSGFWSDDHFASSGIMPK